MEEAGYQVSHYESRSQASVHQYYYTNCSNSLSVTGHAVLLTRPPYGGMPCVGIDDSGAATSESFGGSGGKAGDTVASVGHSGSARSHHQGSGECCHSHESLLKPQRQTEDLGDTVANRLWSWHAHRSIVWGFPRISLCF